MRLEKITERPRRHYDDACGAAHALELIGERWALLVMRELFWGPKRFGDLRAALSGISANVLTQRLEGLEQSGIVIRRKLPPPANVQVYDLTAWGRESEPVFQALGRWAARSPTHDPTLPLSAASLMLSLRTMFDPKRAKDFRAMIGFVIGEEEFVARIEEGRIAIVLGPAEDADVAFIGAARNIAATIYAGQPIAELEKAGALTVQGDRRLAEKFVKLFPLPEKVPR